MSNPNLRLLQANDKRTGENANSAPQQNFFSPLSFSFILRKPYHEAPYRNRNMMTIPPMV